MPPSDPLIDILGVAALWGISPHTVRRWRLDRDERLPEPAVARHRYLRWRASDVICRRDNWLAEQAQEAV